MPTEAQRQGDFTGFPTIYDPYSTRPDPDNPGKFLRDPFAGNRIPQTGIHPTVARYLQDFMPLPNYNVSGLRQNFIDTTPAKNDWDMLVAKVDHNITDNHRVFFRWMHQNQSSASTLPTPTPLSSGSQFHPRNMVAEWNGTLTPELCMVECRKSGGTVS